MLVLSRKLQEQILIPELNISITILSVGTNRVQIGIDAPRDIEITRPDAGHRTKVDLNLDESLDDVPSNTAFASTLQLV
ncbi:MAG: carbon storage regulator [Fuerstiella sp.]|nr:carbon storage regulator [Fuerstiella sp.]MCP4854215.1 carbon storage regulator [Fuerstiella sp.]